MTVQGGGKSTDSYDLKVKKVKEDGDDDEVEAKGVKFKLGDSHSINVRAPMKPRAKGAAAAAPTIDKGKFVPRIKAKPQKADPEHDDKKPGDRSPGDDKAVDKPDGTRPKLGGMKLPAPTATPREKPKAPTAR